MESLVFASWHSRQHINFEIGGEKLDFRVHSAFDVVARPGWRLISEPQITSELWIVRGGEVEIAQSGAHFTARGPCVVLLRGGENRDTRQIGPTLLAIAGFAFDARVWNALDGAALWDFPRHLPLVPPRLPDLIANFLEESQSGAAWSASCAQGWAQLALVEVLRAGGVDNSRAAEKKARFGEFNAALDLVAAHFDEPISVERMAGAVHLSTKHFGREFHAALGLTPMDYVRRVRLGQARDLLASGDQSAAHIARRCGFESAAHFGRAFRREFGVSPGQFRRSLRNPAPFGA